MPNSISSSSSSTTTMTTTSSSTSLSSFTSSASALASSQKQQHRNSYRYHKILMENDDDDHEDYYRDKPPDDNYDDEEEQDEDDDVDNDYNHRRNINCTGNGNVKFSNNHHNNNHNNSFMNFLNKNLKLLLYNLRFPSFSSFSSSTSSSSSSTTTEKMATKSISSRSTAVAIAAKLFLSLNLNKKTKQLRSILKFFLFLLFILLFLIQLQKTFQPTTTATITTTNSSLAEQINSLNQNYNDNDNGFGRFSWLLLSSSSSSPSKTPNNNNNSKSIIRNILNINNNNNNNNNNQTNNDNDPKSNDNVNYVDDLTSLVPKQQQQNENNIPQILKNENNNNKSDTNTNSSDKLINFLHLNDKTGNKTLPNCPLIPPNLVGRLKVLTDPPEMDELEQLFPQIQLGGRFKPKNCQSDSRVAIIIPYRDRKYHLRAFLLNLHPMLMRQNIDYGIYIIEQYGNKPFNRAKLFNVGYLEASKLYPYDCFIFHDVDLIPEDDRNLYTCPKQQPRHMSVAIDKFKYRLPYKDIFGGVSALTREQFEKINGFSNEFWGWGGEDDDMSNRVRHYGYKISRYSSDIARYKMLKHQSTQPNADRFKKLKSGWKRFKTDGINSCDYNVVDIVFKKLFTWISVDLHEPANLKSSSSFHKRKH